MKLKFTGKQWAILGILAVSLAGGGYWAYQSFSPKPATVTTVIGKVQRSDVRKTISATGTVSYPTLINLTFEQAEKLVLKNVAVGDKVKAGQILMQIDPSNLQQAVNQQQANLASAQAKLKQVQDDSLPSALNTLAQAQENLNNKQTALTTAKSNADAAYLTNQVYLANQKVLAASNDLAQAVANAETAKIQSAQTALATAQQALTTAQNAQNGGAAAALRVAQTNFEVAQQSLIIAQEKVEKLKNGIVAADILTAQASVQQAEAQLQTAQTNLSKATMVAPYDGIVTVVTGQVGQVMESTSSNSAKPGVTIAANPDVLQIDTTVGQADISGIQIGQKVEITLDTQPNLKIPGTVSAMAVQGTTASNVVTFGVTVKVDQTGTILKAGMNANVNIVLEEAKNVLTIPSEAIKRMSGKFSVLVPETGVEKAGITTALVKGKPAPVEIGLDDGSNVEIKSGLSEDQLIIVSTRSSSSTTTSGGGTNNPGAGMGALNRATSTGGPR